MQLRQLNMVILLMVLATSVIPSLSVAQRPPRYNPCDSSNDPNCRSGNDDRERERERERERDRDRDRHQPPRHNPRDNQPPRYNPCDVPTDPTCRRHHDNYPSYPNYPTYPTYPSYPSYPTYPTYPDYDDGDVYPNYGNTIERMIYLNRSVMNQSINLRELAGLDSRYAGYRIVSVEANTTPNSSARTVAQLVVDGTVFDSQLNPGYHINLIPQGEVRLNRTAARVNLAISGSTYIQDIRIELSRY